MSRRSCDIGSGRDASACPGHFLIYARFNGRVPITVAVYAASGTSVSSLAP